MELKFTCYVYRKREKRILFTNYERPEKLYDDFVSPSDVNLMLDILNQMTDKDGSAKLENYSGSDVGISELYVCNDNGRYYFTLLEYFEDTSSEVRTANLPVLEKELVEFGGELYPPNAVITDFEFIKKVFSVFLTTHDIPYELMK